MHGTYSSNSYEKLTLIFFSRKLVYDLANATSYEVRAHWNANFAANPNMTHTYYGLGCFSPVVNVMRHPLWGRNQVCSLTTTGHIIGYICSNL